jgi:protein O-mannosyl-transferase
LIHVRDTGRRIPDDKFENIFEPGTRIAIHQPRRLYYILALVALGLVAYGPAIKAPFDFDDGLAITENASIRRLWPPTAPLHTPPLGTAVSGRPVVNYSFALNYALNRTLGIAQAPATESATQTISYHVVNLFLHVATALLLLGVIRRTIQFGRVPESWRDASERIAMISVAIWFLHPIQTEAVDYVSQRTELLVSFCYVGTLYAAVRAWQQEHAAQKDAAETRRRTIAWSLLSVAACLLGMGSKEVMITAPLMIALYDRAFVAERWSVLWRNRARRWLYVALFATAAWVVALVVGGARGGTAGFDLDVTWASYLLTQGWAIPHYVRLLLWPHGLTFDYGRVPVHGPTAVLGLVTLGIAGVATLLAWRSARWRWFGFLGAWFFLILAPSSSIVPIRTEMAAERRAYLAMAAVIVVLVIAAEYLRRDIVSLQRRRPEGSTNAGFRMAALALLASLGVAMIATTARRSAMYDNLVVRWTDGVEETPTNGRAYYNLASALLRANPPRIAAADSVLHRAMAVDSMYVPTRVRSATIAIAQNRLVDAETLLIHALQLHPRDAPATEKLGTVLIALNRPDLALPYVKQFAAFSGTGRSLTTLGLAYLMTRQLDSAIAVLRRAAQIDSTEIDARGYLAGALVEQQRGAEAIPFIRQAIALDPTSGLMFGLLSLAFAQTGQADSAAVAAEAAFAKSPDNATAYVFAGRALQTIGRYADAADYFKQALQISPNDPQILTRLGMAEASMGHSAVAAQLYRKVLASIPDYPLARQGLEQLGRTTNR